MSSYKKYILAIALLLVVVGGIFLLNQSPKETPTQVLQRVQDVPVKPTEQIAQLGFSVQIPPDWTTEVLTELHGGVPSATFRSPRIDSEPFYEFFVSQTSKENYLEYVDAYEHYCQECHKKLIALKSEKVEMYAPYHDEGMVGGTEYFFERAGTYYYLAFSEYDRPRGSELHIELSPTGEKISTQLFNSIQFDR